MKGKIKIERRIEKRTYLKYACSFTVLTEGGLIPFDLIELLDVSKDGLSFILVKDFGAFSEGDEIYGRLYLNSFRSDISKYYLPLKVRIANSTEFIDKEGNKVRYGGNIEYEDNGLKEVIQNFINFIESSSRYFKEDKGDYFISNTVA